MSEQPKQSAEPQDKSAATHERRDSERFPPGDLSTWSVLREDGESEPWAVVRDISVTGIGLIVRQPVRPGDVFIIKLQNKAHRLDRFTPIRVMHTTPQPGGDWLIGCQFVRKLTTSELQMLMDGSEA